jgi:hypothetical protein
MNVDAYEAAMRRRLIAAGFDFNRPDLALAWTVFKRFASEPVECHDSYLFWEASEDYFDFVREFRHYSEDSEYEGVWHEQLTIHFIRSTADRLGVLTSGHRIGTLTSSPLSGVPPELTDRTNGLLQ